MHICARRGATYLSFSSLVSQLRPPTNTLHSCLDMLRGCGPCAGPSNDTWEAARHGNVVLHGVSLSLSLMRDESADSSSLSRP